MADKESPLNQPRDTGPTARERTPEVPDSKESAVGSPTDGNTPSSPQDSEGEGRDTDGPLPDPLTGKPAPAGFDDDSWGELPERFRRRFRNQGNQEFPTRYRDWIDAYYRRMNQVTR